MTRQARHGSAGLEMLLDEDILDDTRLSRVLTAARQPTHAEELAGLAAAKAAFVSSFDAVHRARAQNRRPTASRRFAGRLIALKAAAAVTGATLVGGVAFAASHTNLLNSRTPAHHQQTTRATQPGAPQGSALNSAAVSSGQSVARGNRAGQHGNAPGKQGAGRGHITMSHSPHPTRSATPTPPGQSNPPHRKTPKQHTSNGRSTHPGTPPQSQRSVSHKPSHVPHIQ